MLAAIRELLPFAPDPAALVPRLRAILATLVTGEDRKAENSTLTPPPPPQVAAARRRKPEPRSNGAATTLFVKREDPEWPGLLDRIGQAMKARSTSKIALARIAEVPPSTLRTYLAGAAPPLAVRQRLAVWLDQTAPEVAATPMPFRAVTEADARA